MAPLTIPSPGEPTASGLVLHSRRLQQVLWTAAIGVLLAFVMSAMDHDSVVTASLGIALVLLAFCLWLTHAGRLTAAAGLMLATLTGAMCGLSFISEGIHDTAVLAFPGILIFASMFSTRRIFLALLAIICLNLTALVAASVFGLHVNAVQPTGWGILINVLSIVIGTAFFVWMMASDLRLALGRLKAENERLLESNVRIEMLANHDALTNLPNRALARDRLEKVIAAARRTESSVAVMFLDLDNFKQVNDSLGHSAGDALLCDVADRLVSVVRESDTVSRQGGDEFLVILGGIENEEAATVAAVKILAQLALPFHIGGLDMSATASLGIAMFPKDGFDVDTLLKNSDMAMYRAKDSGRNTLQFFDAEMNSSVIEDLHLATGIRQALANDEFRVFYQPQFELKTGRIVGAEALLRWKHPTLGNIPPGKFIPVAERSGLINEIGTWVLNDACRQTKAWQDQGLCDLVVAVNVSPVQFRRDDIEREVANALATWNVAPSCIELELTESLLIADSEHLSGVLDRLRSMGIQFAIDDFGTGYSNLGYLKRFDVQRLKIDQSFVRRMTEKKCDEGIVRAIIEMAHCLDLEVVAEGVEDAATLARLTELGCEFGQGYHWSPALPAHEFLDFVRAHRRSTGEFFGLQEQRGDRVACNPTDGRVQATAPARDKAGPLLDQTEGGAGAGYPGKVPGRSRPPDQCQLTDRAMDIFKSRINA